MAETVAIDRPSVAKPVSRPRSRKPATVSASALALHLDCTRTYIGKLEAEGVIQRQGDGFPLDQSRVAYCDTCGASAAIAAQGGRRRSRQGQDRDVQLRLMEKRRELVRRDEHEAMIDQMAGLVLTKLGGWPARIAGQTSACDGGPKPCCENCAPRLPKPRPSWRIRPVNLHRTTTHDDRRYDRGTGLRLPSCARHVVHRNL